MSRWLHIVGIAEDGLAGLAPATRAIVAAAEIIIGGDRHRLALEELSAERIDWPDAFPALIALLRALRGRRVVVLVAGDPLWFSIGARITNPKYPDYLPRDEVFYHPQISAFQLAAARMGWSLADLEMLTVMGRSARQIIPHFAPGVRLLVLTQDRTSPAIVAALLTEAGYGPSEITVLGALGGANETRLEGRAETADAWAGDAPDFHTLAIACCAAPGAVLLPRGPGLPDSAFRHDGEITSQELRALALSQLWPRRGAVLWDIGAGCGAVGIEWMRAAPEAQAIGIEPRADRRALAVENALLLGTPRLELIDGLAPEALTGLPAPDAVFMGGGLSEESVAACLAALKPNGRLVAHAVTQEAEALLIAMQGAYGGSLTRLSLSHAAAGAPFRGWQAAMPVTQWALGVP